MILGRRSIMRTSVTEPGEVVELTRDQLLSLIQTDTEIADVVMRAFIYRRLELVAKGIGDVVLVGSMHSGDTLRIREFLTRNGHPFAYMDWTKIRTFSTCWISSASRSPRSPCSSAAAMRC